MTRLTKGSCYENGVNWSVYSSSSIKSNFDRSKFTSVRLTKVKERNYGKKTISKTVHFGFKWIHS